MNADIVTDYVYIQCLMQCLPLGWNWVDIFLIELIYIFATKSIVHSHVNPVISMTNLTSLWNSVQKAIARS